MKSQILIQPILLFFFCTLVFSQSFYFIFNSYIISVPVAITFQYLLSSFISNRIKNKKIADSLAKYDKLTYKKYPMRDVPCASCKSPANFLLDWDDLTFKCPVCKANNGLEIIVSPYVKAEQDELIRNPLDKLEL